MFFNNTIYIVQFIYIYTHENENLCSKNDENRIVLVKTPDILRYKYLLIGTFIFS